MQMLPYLTKKVWYVRSYHIRKIVHVYDILAYLTKKVWYVRS
jgi:hypothetical protein